MLGSSRSFNLDPRAFTEPQLGNTTYSNALRCCSCCGKGLHGCQTSITGVKLGMANCSQEGQNNCKGKLHGSKHNTRMMYCLEFVWPFILSLNIELQHLMITGYVCFISGHTIEL